MLKDCYLGLVYRNPPLGHKVPKNNAFTNHEVALFLVKYQVLLLASLQDFVKILQTVVKGFAIDQEIIHENLHDFYYHV